MHKPLTPCSTVVHAPPTQRCCSKQVSKKYSRRGERVVRHTLADGSVKTYRYQAYRADNKPKQAKTDTLDALIKAWERSPEWQALAPNSQSKYAHYLRYLMPMGPSQIKTISRKDIISTRNAVAKIKGPAAGNLFKSTVSAMFGWAVENGWLDYSPATKIKRLKTGHLPTWSQAEVDLALQHLPEYLRRAVILALYTGQRRSDLITMTWAAYDGHRLRIVQRKTKTKLVIPVHPVLKAELDTWKQETQTPTILTNSQGRPWKQENGISDNLGQRLSRIDGFPEHRNLHGLRKLAGVNLAEAGCSAHEIAAILGHQSLSMVQLYTAAVDQERLAEAAIIKLRRGPPSKR